MLEAILGNELFTLCALAYKTFSASPPLFLSLVFPGRTCTRSTENKDDSDLVGIKDGRVRETDSRRVGVWSVGNVFAGSRFGFGFGFAADRCGSRLGLGLGSGSVLVVMMMVELVLDGINNSHTDLFYKVVRVTNLYIKKKQKKGGNKQFLKRRSTHDFPQEVALAWREDHHF